jgi:glyoxalase family protein
MSGERRLRIAGIHHVTLLCGSLERSVAFYRNVLGMRVVDQGPAPDDPSARQLVFGDERGRPGTLITCLEYPRLRRGTVGAGSTHHFALTVESAEELEGWRTYLTSRGVPCSEVLDRVHHRSLYLRDPDGHVVELASAGPGYPLDD